jgi:hypothetical protein
MAKGDWADSDLGFGLGCAAMLLALAALLWVIGTVF